MAVQTVYKGFYIKLRKDHQTATYLFVGTMQGLRLTARDLPELKSKIDARAALRAEVSRMEFKRVHSVRFNDYSDMYVENYEVSRLVNQAVSQSLTVGGY